MPSGYHLCIFSIAGPFSTECISNISASDISDCDVQEKNEELNQFWQEFLSFYVKNNISLVCLENVAKLMNKIPGRRVHIPETKFKILQKFRRGSNIPFDFYINCDNCKAYTV